MPSTLYSELQDAQSSDNTERNEDNQLIESNDMEKLLATSADCEVFVLYDSSYFTNEIDLENEFLFDSTHKFITPLVLGDIMNRKAGLYVKIICLINSPAYNFNILQIASGLNYNNDFSDPSHKKVSVKDDNLIQTALYLKATKKEVIIKSNNLNHILLSIGYDIKYVTNLSLSVYSSVKEKGSRDKDSELIIYDTSYIIGDLHDEELYDKKQKVFLSCVLQELLKIGSDRSNHMFIKITEAYSDGLVNIIQTFEPYTDRFVFNDTIILCECLRLMAQGNKVILKTNDKNMLYEASTMGILCSLGNDEQTTTSERIEDKTKDAKKHWESLGIYSKNNFVGIPVKLVAEVHQGLTEDTALSKPTLKCLHGKNYYYPCDVGDFVRLIGSNQFYRIESLNPDRNLKPAVPKFF